MADKDQEQARKERGDKFRNARKALGLTQAEVAIAANVHVNFCARVERVEENPSWDRLRSIMKVLKIRSSDLV